MVYGICDVLWLRLLLSELGFSVSSPMRLYWDNKVAISIAHNLVQYDRTKHIEVDHHLFERNSLVE